MSTGRASGPTVQRVGQRYRRPTLEVRRPIGVRHGPSLSLALGAAGTSRPAGGNPTS
jgi:hypothetical protein